MADVVWDLRSHHRHHPLGYHGGALTYLRGLAFSVGMTMVFFGGYLVGRAS